MGSSIPDFLSVLLNVGQDKKRVSTFCAYDGILSFAGSEKLATSYILFSAVSMWYREILEKKSLSSSYLAKLLDKSLIIQYNEYCDHEANRRLIEAIPKLKGVSNSSDIISALSMDFKIIDLSVIEKEDWNLYFASYFQAYTLVVDVLKKYQINVHAGGQLEDFIAKCLRKQYNELLNAFSHLFLVSNKIRDFQHIVDMSKSHLQRGILDALKLCLTIINEKDIRNKCLLGINARCKELLNISNGDKLTIITDYTREINLFVSSVNTE